MAYWKMLLSMQKKKWRFGDGFQKMGLQQRWSRTQKSEKILREMNESQFRSLGKWFSREKMCDEGEKASGRRD